MGEQERLDEEQEDDCCSEIIDGRLSAIMPRKLFQDDAAVKSGLLQVYVRMKPVPASTDTCMVLDNSHLLKATWRNKEAVYKFSKVFQQDAGQTDVYSGTTASLVEDFLDFRQPSAVVMAYGVTSAGKTFTMQGSADKPGLVPLALKGIFQTINSSGNSNTCKISLSVCEIYNESIHDLLAPASMRAKPAALRLKEDKAGHISVVGMTEVPVGSDREALELLRRAAKARQCAGTAVNEHSSRSHAVITVKLQSAAGSSNASLGGCFGSVVPSLQQSYLHFVDLAGCERVKRTGNSGARLRESVAINSSLMTLARCLEVLRYNQQHPGDQKVIPYRESKITHLFKQVLHGNGRFVMVVNVSPACEAFNETKRVLQYAALASKVTMTSEIEQDLAGAGPHHLLPPEADSAAALHSTAAEDASAAAVAAAAALSAAQARIEELLDDKADLEYEIDVVERKVELLREELIKCEVEKEQLEADIRAEVQEEMQQLLDAAAAKERARSAKAEEEAVSLRHKVQQLERQLEEQSQQHNADSKLIKELQAAADQAGKRSVLSVSEHKRLLQEVKQAAASAAVEGEAEHIAQIAILTKEHQQQLQQLQRELAAARQEVHTLQQAAAAEAQQQASAAAQQQAVLQSAAAEALQLLEQATGSQQQNTAGTQDLCVALQHLQASLLAQQQQQQQEQEQQQTPEVGTAAAEKLAAVQRLAFEALQLLEQAAEHQQQQGAARMVLDVGDNVLQQLQASLAASQALLQQEHVQQEVQAGIAAAGSSDPAAGTDAGEPAAQRPEQAGRDAETVLNSKELQQQQRQCKASRSRRATLAGSTAAAPEAGAGQRSRRTTMAAGSRCLPSLQGEQMPSQAAATEEEEEKAPENVSGPATAPLLPAAAKNAERYEAVACVAVSAEVGAAAAEAAAAPAAAAVAAVAGAAKRRRRTIAAAAAGADVASEHQPTADSAAGVEPAASNGSRARSSSRRKTMHRSVVGKVPDEDEAAAAAAAGSAGGLQQPTGLDVIAEEEEEEQQDPSAGAGDGGEAADQGNRRELHSDQLAAGAAGAAGTAEGPGGAVAGDTEAALLPPQPAVSRKRRRDGDKEEGPQPQLQQRADHEGCAISSRRQQQDQPTEAAAGFEEQQGKHKRQRQDLEAVQQQLEQSQVPGAGPAAVEGGVAADDAAEHPEACDPCSEGVAANAAFAPGVAAAGALRKVRGGGRAAAGSKLPARRKRRASGDGCSIPQEQQQQQLAEQQEEEEEHGSKHPERKQQSTGVASAAAAPATGHQERAGRKLAAAGKKGRSRGCEADQEEVQWQPAERVLQDVTQHQLGVVVGRRATIAAIGGSSGVAGGARRATGVKAGRAAAGGGGSDAGTSQQQLPHIAGGITPVAFRTRHRRV